MAGSIRTTLAESAEHMALARAIRHEVFVLEQSVPAEVEADGLDGEASHFLAWFAERAAGTGRVRRTAKGYKLERVAVLAGFRGRALGAALVRAMLEAVPEAAPAYLHAQESAIGFWQKLGFFAQGPAFVEGGISHRYMLLGVPAPGCT